MNSKYCAMLILASCILFVISCETSTTTAPKIDEPGFEITKVLPSNPKIGETLKIILNKEVIGSSYDGFVYFDNNWSHSDSIKSDTIFTFLPFIKSKSSVEVKIYLYEENERLELVQDISIDNTCYQPICVMQNDEGKIYDYDILPKDLIGETPKWEITQNTDTITISTFMIIADESNQTIKITFLESHSGMLPTFLNYIRKKSESNGADPPVTTCDTLKTGIIKVEDWDNNGIYSGKVYAELEPFESTTYLHPKTIFWLNNK